MIVLQKLLVHGLALPLLLHVLPLLRRRHGFEGDGDGGGVSARVAGAVAVRQAVGGGGVAVVKAEGITGKNYGINTSELR